MEPTIPSRKRLPTAVWLGLTLVVILDTPMQLIWKSLMTHHAGSGFTLLSETERLIKQPLFWTLLLLFGLQFLNWMWVLGEADLSFAQPFTALSYLTISSGAVWIFPGASVGGPSLGHHVDPRRRAARGVDAAQDGSHFMTAGDRLIGISAVLLSTGAEAVAQLSFKRGAVDPTNRVRAILQGIGAFVIDAALWSIALYYLDVTVAHPIGSLVFVEVAILSRWRLGERLPPRRWAGVILILIGSVLVAMT